MKIIDLRTITACSDKGAFFYENAKVSDLFSPYLTTRSQATLLMVSLIVEP